MEVYCKKIKKIKVFSIFLCFFMSLAVTYFLYILVNILILHQSFLCNVIGISTWKITQIGDFVTNTTDTDYVYNTGTLWLLKLLFGGHLIDSWADEVSVLSSLLLLFLKILVQKHRKKLAQKTQKIGMKNTCCFFASLSCVIFVKT